MGERVNDERGGGSGGFACRHKAHQLSKCGMRGACINPAWRNVSYSTNYYDGALRRSTSKLCGHSSTRRSALLTMPPQGVVWMQSYGEGEMWAALLTVAALSLLTSSAFAAYATYRYFTGEEEPDLD
jgi:hypothetical protein